ncbi:MAG: hypothetical protein AAFQ83_05940 [Bacteroidota bacterium]
MSTTSSYTLLYRRFCENAIRVIARKLQRQLSPKEIQSVYRLSNLTFAEMTLADFDKASNPQEAEEIFKSLRYMAHQRFQMEIEDLGQKLQQHFGVSIPEGTKKLLLQKGTAIDIHEFWEHNGKVNKLKPKFIRKAEIRQSLLDLEEYLLEL